MPDCIPLQPTQEFQTARLLLSHLNLLTLNAVKPKPQARIGPDVRYFSSCFDRATRHRGADIKGHSYFSAKCIRTHLAFFCCVLRALISAYTLSLSIIVVCAFQG